MPVPRAHLRHLLRSRCLLGHRLRSSAANGSPEVDHLMREFVDYVLRHTEKRHVLGEGVVHSVETNQVPSNNPCEDMYTVAHCKMSDTWLAGVFDGHAGDSCSRHLAKCLFDYVSSVQIMDSHDPTMSGQSPLPMFDDLLVPVCTSVAHKLSPVTMEMHEQRIREFMEHAQRYHTVRERLQAAFQACDDDISRAAQPAYDGEPINPMRTAIAASGSCACVAHISGNDLHVANVGDSQAVLASVAADTGGWTARRLSRSHHIENTTEVQRVRNAHPLREYDTVLRGGRLLGQLYPLRSFGDVAYKWPADLQRKVLEPVYGAHCVPPHLHTPPYLTANPEVFYHRLTPNDRFLIIASDGLWDFMTPDSVVRLLSDHMVGKQTLAPYVHADAVTVKQVMSDLRARKIGEAKRPVDDNGATHIMRHAIGGSTATSQYRKLYASLSVPSDMARDYRDDISIVVVYFDADQLQEQHDAQQLDLSS